MKTKVALRNLTFACAILLTSALSFAQADDLAAKSQRAKRAMSDGRFEEAVALYAELVRVIPDNPGLLMNLGLALHSAGRYREAIRQFQAVTKLQPSSGHAWLFLGLAHLKLGEPAKAIDPLRRALRADPKNKIALLELADALLSADRPEEAAAQFQKLTEIDPDNPKAWQGLGLSYLAMSQRAFAEIEKMSPQSAYWYMLLARSFASRGNYYTAFDLYKQALAKAPNLRGIYSGLAEVYRNTGHPDWASIAEERERNLTPPDCTRQNLECDFLAGRYRQVIDAARADKTPEALYWLALACGQLSHQAFEHLAQMPPSPAIHELMAEAYRIQGKYDLAVKEWEEALKLAPEDGRMMKGLARALWLNREYQRARPLLEGLIRLEPESADLNFWLGDTVLNSEIGQNAIPYLEKAVRYSTDNKAAHASLGRAYMRMGLAEKAIPHLKAALDLDDDGSLYYQLAQAYRRAGHKELAEQTMRKFQSISEAARKRRRMEGYQITPP